MRFCSLGHKRGCWIIDEREEIVCPLLHCEKSYRVLGSWTSHLIKKHGVEYKKRPFKPRLYLEEEKRGTFPSIPSDPEQVFSDQTLNDVGVESGGFKSLEQQAEKELLSFFLHLQYGSNIPASTVQKISERFVSLDGITTYLMEERLIGDLRERGLPQQALDTVSDSLKHCPSFLKQSLQPGGKLSTPYKRDLAADQSVFYVPPGLPSIQTLHKYFEFEGFS